MLHIYYGEFGESMMFTIGVCRQLSAALQGMTLEGTMEGLKLMYRRLFGTPMWLTVLYAPALRNNVDRYCPPPVW